MNYNELTSSPGSPAQGESLVSDVTDLHVIMPSAGAD